jgi:hypothetical protein
MLTASVASLTSAYTLLANGVVTGVSGPTQQCTHRPPHPSINPNGYCWTHGYKVKWAHTSAMCTNKKEGHKDTATCANTMGGSQHNKEAST